MRHRRTAHRTVVPGLLRVVAPLMMVIGGVGWAQSPSSSDHDRDGAAAVENELDQDPLVFPDGVHVTLDDGVAALRGTVSSLVAKERAARIAETVKGVKEVVNRITVRSQGQRSAAEIESMVEHMLRVNPATELFQVNVAAEQSGVVHLTGKVDSWIERELAERVAARVLGVTEVRNDLRLAVIRDPRPDSELAAEIERLLRWDAYIEDGNIDVSVKDGNVRLSGSVGSAAEKRRAISMAWTAGTRDIDAGMLEVHPQSERQPSSKLALNASDAAIAAAVKSRLAIEPGVPGAGLDVEVEEGVVTLQGEVETLHAQRAARSAAAQVFGVERVQDHMRFQPPRLDEQAIRQDVVQALDFHPVTEAYEIDVRVQGGEVTLAGKVDSWIEKGVADSVVAGVQGVVNISNDLEVRNHSARFVFDPYVDPRPFLDHDWYRPDAGAVLKSDSAIEQAIEQQLFWSPFVDANEVEVSVRNGVATLRGQVDTPAESRAAAENAFEGGASGIVNDLRIAS